MVEHQRPISIVPEGNRRTYAQAGLSLLHRVCPRVEIQSGRSAGLPGAGKTTFGGGFSGDVLGGGSVLLGGTVIAGTSVDLNNLGNLEASLQHLSPSDLNRLCIEPLALLWAIHEGVVPFDRSLIEGCLSLMRSARIVFPVNIGSAVFDLIDGHLATLRAGKAAEAERKAREAEAEARAATQVAEAARRKARAASIPEEEGSETLSYMDLADRLKDEGVSLNGNILFERMEENHQLYKALAASSSADFGNDEDEIYHRVFFDSVFKGNVDHLIKALKSGVVDMPMVILYPRSIPEELSEVSVIHWLFLQVLGKNFQMIPQRDPQFPDLGGLNFERVVDILPSAMVRASSNRSVVGSPIWTSRQKGTVVKDLKAGFWAPSPKMSELVDSQPRLCFVKRVANQPRTDNVHSAMNMFDLMYRFGNTVMTLEEYLFFLALQRQADIKADTRLPDNTFIRTSSLVELDFEGTQIPKGLCCLDVRPGTNDKIFLTPFGMKCDGVRVRRCFG